MQAPSASRKVRKQYQRALDTGSERLTVTRNICVQLAVQRAPWHSAKLAMRVMPVCTLVYRCIALQIRIHHEPQAALRPGSHECGSFLSHHECGSRGFTTFSDCWPPLPLRFSLLVIELDVFPPILRIWNTRQSALQIRSCDI